MEAFDFQVDVSSGGEGGYEVTARTPQGGEATASMRLPLTPRELEALVVRIKDAVIASSATVRRSLTSEEQPVQELGRILFDSLLADNVRGCCSQAVSARPMRAVGSGWYCECVLPNWPACHGNSYSTRATMITFA